MSECVHLKLFVYLSNKGYLFNKNNHVENISKSAVGS